MGYAIENRLGFPREAVRVTDETPREAQQRRAAQEAHKAATNRADFLRERDARRRTLAATLETRLDDLIYAARAADAPEPIRALANEVREIRRELEWVR